MPESVSLLRFPHAIPKTTTQYKPKWINPYSEWEDEMWCVAEGEGEGDSFQSLILWVRLVILRRNIDT